MIKRFLAVMAATVAVLAASGGAALAQYPPTSGTGAVSATTITVGGFVDFSGGGFAPGSDVTVSVNTAVYATVVASGASSSALGGSSAHFVTAAFAQPAAATSSASFKVRITMDKVGTYTLTGAGVGPAGNAHVVTATVTVIPAAATKATNDSTLPFTGSSVLVPGLIIGLTMVAGGFVLLTSVRSRKATARS